MEIKKVKTVFMPDNGVMEDMVEEMGSETNKPTKNGVVLKVEDFPELNGASVDKPITLRGKVQEVKDDGFLIAIVDVEVPKGETDHSTKLTAAKAIIKEIAKGTPK